MKHMNNKIVFIANTTAQYRYIHKIKTLHVESGGQAQLFIRNDRELFENKLSKIYRFGITKKSKFSGIFQLPIYIIQIMNKIDKNARIVFGGGIVGSVISLLCGAQHINYIDGDPEFSIFQHVELTMMKLLKSIVITPWLIDSTKIDGQIQIHSIKEKSYINTHHIDHDNYILIRINAFDSIHDENINQVADLTKKAISNLISTLDGYTEIRISSELTLSGLDKYIVKQDQSDYLDILSKSMMVISQGGTTVTESVLLGTPAIFVHPKGNKLSIMKYLEEKGLIQIYEDLSSAVESIPTLIINGMFLNTWSENHKLFLSELEDFNLAIYNIIIEYL